MTGVAIRLVGYGLIIHSRGANASDAEIVWSQLGGFSAVSLQVSAQAPVPHADVAMVTAVVLITEIGRAIVTSIGMSCSGTLLKERALTTRFQLALCP